MKGNIFTPIVVFQTAAERRYEMGARHPRAGLREFGLVTPKGSTLYRRKSPEDQKKSPIRIHLTLLLLWIRLAKRRYARLGLGLRPHVLKIACKSNAPTV